MKIMHYLSLSIGAIFLAFVEFSFLRLFLHNKEKFQVVARKRVSQYFRFFLHSTRFFGLTRFKDFDKNDFKNLHSRVIVANHPSILDFVFLMAMVPSSNCIVRGGLLHSPFGGIIKNAYIPNSLDFEDLCKKCKSSLAKGCNVIIFPEGTRTPRNGRNQYKKGAARIAFYAHCNLLPVFVGGSDKYGLGKGDPIWSFNGQERILYDFKFLDEIKYQDYKELSETIAAKHMTEKAEEMIRQAAAEYENNHPDCETINNV